VTKRQLIPATRKNPRLFINIDPRELRLPTSRLTGADPFKLQRQIARFGPSIIGMPPPEVHRDKNGLLMVYDGVARATRIAKLTPGQLITVEIPDEMNGTFDHLPTIGSLLP